MESAPETAEPPNAPPRPRPSAPHPRGDGRGTQASSPAIRSSWRGRRGLTRQRSCRVVIRPRLEDTVKMAAASGLMRRPLEQVDSGTRASARSLPTLRPLSASSLSPPGLRAAEEALPPDGTGGTAGRWPGRRPGQGGGSQSRGGCRGRACAVGRERRQRALESTDSHICLGLVVPLLRPSARHTSTLPPPGSLVSVGDLSTLDLTLLPSPSF